jgi:hypothetical protein
MYVELSSSISAHALAGLSGRHAAPACLGQHTIAVDMHWHACTITSCLVLHNACHQLLGIWVVCLPEASTE